MKKYMTVVVLSCDRAHPRHDPEHAERLLPRRLQQIEVLFHHFDCLRNLRPQQTAGKLESVFGPIPNDETKEACLEICLKLVYELNQFFGETENNTETVFRTYYRVGPFDQKLVDKGVDFASISSAEDLGQPMVVIGQAEANQNDANGTQHVSHSAHDPHADPRKPPLGQTSGPIDPMHHANDAHIMKEKPNAIHQDGATPTPSPYNISLEEEVQLKDQHIKESLKELAQMLQQNPVFNQDIGRLPLISRNVQ